MQAYLDIATITDIIVQHQSYPSPGHVEAAKYVICYLKGTSILGITFTSKTKSSIKSFVKFPIPQEKLEPFSDSNWVPKGASNPKPYLCQQTRTKKYLWQQS
jgi:hypothetical protein